MTTTIQTTDLTTGFAFTANGQTLVVMPGVDVSNDAGGGISGGYGVQIQVLGSVAGSGNGIGVGGTGESTLLMVGAQGSVDGNDYIGVDIAGSSTIDNYGLISDSAVNGDGLDLTGPNVTYNYGSISALGSGGWAIQTNDTTTGGVTAIYNYGSIVGQQYSYNSSLVNSAADQLVNFGTMTGGVAYGGVADCYLVNSGSIDGNITLGGGAHSYLVNSGSIDGSVTLGSGADQSVNSTWGTISGTITCGSGGGVVIAGQTGGSVVGSGDDVFYANPTQTAADNAAKTTLDGGTGDNWLYGDGAYTTFMSGDDAAGTYNQIFGGASQMEGVSGYTNNTVSYASLSSAYKSAYIDLLHGDAYMCTIADANGAPSSDLVFEDYLQNVPNVIGTSGSDVILCDNGVDRITHGSSAGDVLYAGTGAASQDTFAYTNLNESSLSHHDVIEGFKVGIDKINLTALDMPIADVLLSYGGNGSNTIYVEKDPSAGFNSATDMILSVKASTNTAMTYKDIIA
jgi:hypothetical protein